MTVYRPGKCKLVVSSDLLNSIGTVWDRSVGSHVWVARPCFRFSLLCFGLETDVYTEQNETLRQVGFLVVY